MSDTAVTALNLDPAKLATAKPEQRRTALRQAVEEMVGVTFFGEMLKIARNSRLKGTIGHGGRGEEIFGSQLDLELARRVGQGMRNSLSETIYNRLAKRI